MGALFSLVVYCRPSHAHIRLLSNKSLVSLGQGIMDNMAFPICIHRASGGVIAG